jgi:hypothetical protein
MADFTNLKDEIKSKIKSNGKQEITGAVLQQTMLEIIDETDRELTELSADLFGVAKNIYERKTIEFVVPNKFISLETGKLTAAGGYYSSDFIGLQDVSIIVANSNIPSTIALVAFYANEYEDSFISSLSAEFNERLIYSKDFQRVQGLLGFRVALNKNTTQMFM